MLDATRQSNIILSILQFEIDGLWQLDCLMVDTQLHYQKDEIATMQKFIIELSGNDNVSVFCLNGSNISPKSQLYKDLANCCKSGDAEQACKHVLETYRPQFRIVRWIGLEADGKTHKYENGIASHREKASVCQAIYFESETNFAGSESRCDLYLIWQAADSVVNCQ